MDGVSTIQCSIQITAARFRHQLHLSSIAASQIGEHRHLGRVPDRRVARKFDRGGKQQPSFNIMPIVFKASFRKCAFLWHFFF